MPYKDAARLLNSLFFLNEVLTPHAWIHHKVGNFLHRRKNDKTSRQNL
jgi:hypothetical protein